MVAPRSALTTNVFNVCRFGCFGGVITTVGMETLGWYRYEGCTVDSEGIGKEVSVWCVVRGAWCVVCVGQRKFKPNSCFVGN